MASLGPGRRNSRTQPKSRSVVIEPLERTAAILSLQDERLYYPANVAASVIDPRKDPQRYERFRKNLYSFARQRGTFGDRPDNAIYEPGCEDPKTVEKHGRKHIVLQPGEHYPSWYGKTWKQQLKPQEVDAYHVHRHNLEKELLKLLAHFLSQQQKDKPLKSDTQLDVAGNRPKNQSPSFRRDFGIRPQRVTKWKKGLFLGTLLTTITVLGFLFIFHNQASNPTQAIFLSPTTTQWEDLTLAYQD